MSDGSTNVDFPTMRRPEGVVNQRVHLPIITLEDLLSQTVKISYEQEKTEKTSTTRVCITCKDNASFLRLLGYLTDEGFAYSITTVDGRHKVTVLD